MPLSADGTTVQLEVGLNGTQLPIAAEAVRATQTVLTPSPSLLQPGRNLITAFVPSTHPDAALNGGFLVVHRVFFVDDQDGDGLADTADPAPGAVDADGDGLLDSVEAHSVGGAGISGTSADGVASITSLEPPFLIPGRAVALRGTGFENIDAAAEVQFAGQPAAQLLRTSPTQLVVQAPASLPAGTVDVAVSDAAGLPQATAMTHPDATPLPFKNLVLVSSIFAQQFFDSAGGLVPSRAENIPLFLNMLPFGSATRVLIDASRMDPTAQVILTPDLEVILELHGGANATTRLAGTLSDSVLQDVDLLVLLLSNVLVAYGPSELQAIEDWIREPGHRLVVVSSSLDPVSNTVANEVLLQVGATSLFDPFFPLSLEQEDKEYLAAVAGFFVDPPFTDGVDVLSHRLPTNILLGPGANETSRVGICRSTEAPITVPGPDPAHPLLVGCQDIETGQQLGVIEATYVASEEVPTAAGSVRILRVAPGTTLAGAVDVPGAGFVKLPESPQSITAEAEVRGFAASSAVFMVGSQSVTVPVAPGQTRVTATLSGLDPAAFPLGLHVEAQGPAANAADAVIVARTPQRVKTRFTVFADSDGTPAVDPAVLAAAQRQAGLELQALCAGTSDAATGLPLPPLGSALAFEGGVAFETVADPTQNQEIFNLVAFDETQAGVTEMAVNLAMGLNPDGTPNASIPDPSPGGAAGPVPIRIFAVHRFLRMNPVDGQMPIEVPQEPETGISIFANAFFGNVSGNAKDVVLLQVRDGDLEGDTLQVDRPVASSLAHELMHVLAGVQDNANEVAPGNGEPLDLPTPGQPSVMNSFPFFRSLSVGSGALVRDCDEGSIGMDPSGTDAICSRALDGYACALAGPFDFTE